MISSDKQADLLFEHYRDCETFVKEQITLRFRLVMVVFALQAVFALGVIYPTAVAVLFTTGVEHLVSAQPSALGQWFKPYFVNSTLWFVLSLVFLQVLTRSTVIDREVDYLCSLEQRLEALTGARAITRRTEFCQATIRYIHKTNSFYLFGSLIFVLSISLLKIASEVAHARSDIWPARIFTAIDLWIFILMVYFCREYVRSERASKGQKVSVPPPRADATHSS